MKKANGSSLSFQDKAQERAKKRERSLVYRTDRAIERAVTSFGEKLTEHKLLAQADRGNSYYSKRLFIRVHSSWSSDLYEPLVEAIKKKAIYSYIVKNELDAIVSFDREVAIFHDGYATANVVLHVRWDRSTPWETIIKNKHSKRTALVHGRR